MKRRKWTSKEKAMVVLEGLKGRPLGEICAEHRINQSQYYQWRDLFLSNASKAFEARQVSQKEARLESENERLKRMIGELTLELKKNDELLG